MGLGIKKLGYRCQGQTTQEAAADHWEGFTFTGGRVQVVYAGPWGQLQVWAASEAEGRRVIEHACSHAGISPTDPEGTWQAAAVASSRYREGVTYRVKVRYGRPVVTVRQGSAGLPYIESEEWTA